MLTSSAASTNISSLDIGRCNMVSESLSGFVSESKVGPDWMITSVKTKISHRHLIRFFKSNLNDNLI
jgi:hypothetical protein